MRRGIVVLMLLSGVALADTHVQVVRRGVEVADPGPTLAANVVRLLQSCNVDTTQEEIRDDLWEHLLRASFYVRVQLDPAGQEIRTRANSYLADEIYIRLPSPGNVFVKFGDAVYSCARYTPQALLAVGREPAVGLANTPQYQEIAKYVAKNQPRKQKK